MLEKTDTLQPANARGGNWLRQEPTRLCTSGFSVRTATERGVVTAAHCNGLNKLEEANGALRNMAFRFQVPTYAHGDVEWHALANADGLFYGDPNIVYGQNFIRHTNAMEGLTVCAYGRSSNVQNCNYHIDGVGACFLAGAPINGQVCDVAITTNWGNPALAGDSGGPVFFTDTVFGVLSSSNFFGMGFTPVEVMQTQLGVLVFN
ncbi:MAG TPA: hypothetical protein VJV78_49775 [Polyangiales bacterium]|nr:hypothetical protein [Polyangiales bacterium]